MILKINLLRGILILYPKLLLKILMGYSTEETFIEGKLFEWVNGVVCCTLCNQLIKHNHVHKRVIVKQ